jgi:hypothetical protein
VSTHTASLTVGHGGLADKYLGETKSYGAFIRRIQHSRSVVSHTKFSLTRVDGVLLEWSGEGEVVEKRCSSVALQLWVHPTLQLHLRDKRAENSPDHRSATPPQPAHVTPGMAWGWPRTDKDHVGGSTEPGKVSVRIRMYSTMPQSTPSLATQRPVPCSFWMRRSSREDRRAETALGERRVWRGRLWVCAIRQGSRVVDGR